MQENAGNRNKMQEYKRRAHRHEKSKGECIQCMCNIGNL